MSAPAVDVVQGEAEGALAHRRPAIASPDRSLEIAAIRRCGAAIEPCASELTAWRPSLETGNPIAEATKPDTLRRLCDGGIDIVFSSIGISRQRDGLTFEQVDYQANRNLINVCLESGVRKFVYVSMLGAERIAHLAITRAHERVVADLEASGLDYSIVRPSGYFSDMGAVLAMARRGRVLLVGGGSNSFNPIHGRDLARVCADAAEGGGRLIEAGGPDILTQREVAELAFDVVGKPVKITVIPLWLAFGIARLIGKLNRQFGDLAEFIVTAGEVDGIGPKRGTTTLRSYFEELARER